MKVLCDVCKREEAAVYCCADEAALCVDCDARVHRANKLAGKHRRFSLLHPASPQRFPLCDICQEKRALLFCQEDRALLCRDCDAPIHAANDLTKKHSRFLLTGIKLSPSATTPEGAAASSASDCPGSLAVSSSSTTSEEAGEPPGDVNHVKSRDHLAGPKQQKTPAGVLATAPVSSGESGTNGCRDIGYGGKVMAQDKTPVSVVAAAAGGGSSISEYLIKELPGWRVEDFLLDAVPALLPAAYPFSKIMTSDIDPMAPFLEADLDDAGAFPADDGGDLSGWWVPQVPQVAPTLPPLQASRDSSQQRFHAIGSTGMGGDSNKLAARVQLQQQYLQEQQQQQQHHHHHRWASDDCFTVPEISTVQPHRQQNPPSSYKRTRPI